MIARLSGTGYTSGFPPTATPPAESPSKPAAKVYWRLSTKRHSIELSILFYTTINVESRVKWF